jgi:hypothetical protein
MRVSENIALIMSYWETEVLFFVYAADRETSNLFKQLNDSRIVVTEGSDKSHLRTHRLAYGRNMLMGSVAKHVKERKDNVDEVFVAVMDLDDVNTHPFRKYVFEAAMNLYRSWDVVSFNRYDYYDVWALRYERYNFNLWTSVDAFALCDIIGRDIKSELERCNSALYPVYSAFNGFGIYKYNYTQGCHYIGSYRIGDKTVADCEHVPFHKCITEKHNARIMIYTESLFDNYTKVVKKLS